MNAEELIAQYLSDDGAIAPGIALIAERAQVRQQVYKALLASPRRPFHGLLRHLFQEEIKYRNALWSGDVEDEDDHFEGIYRCAFLLGGCSDPSDTLTLWEAKHINMDVGCSMGAEYFIGAGLDETLRFLEQSSAAEASQVSEYVRGWFAQSNALEWQKAWGDERADDIREL
ncbi:hypothetical protein [Pseudoduganella violaceinigra]|uniref:hypothetical protein n=1 Tax=Pseudoduganella violaceinigra TaxID=246602 RepID=UPI00041A0912|nr:hypothetical protein [Pseudoduganella violaceinigra]